MELNKPLVVAEIELQEALSFGQVLVKVHYSGICGAQINEIDGVKGPDKFLPHLLGHEGSATVLEIGAGVRSVQPGDRVVMHWRQSSGIQSETPSYNWNGDRVNAGWVTTFNEFSVVSENRVTPIPETFDLRLAPLFGCAVTTAFGVINNDARVKVGQSIVVIGTGGVGINIVQAAHMVSAHPIIGIDIIDQKLAMAERFGATTTLNARHTGNLHDRVRDLVGTSGADIVVETTGNSRLIETAYELTHPDGKTILVGVPRKGDNISIYSLPLHFRKVLTGSHGGNAEPHVDIPRLVKLCEVDKLKLNGLVTHEFELGAVNEAIDLVRSGQAGRVLLKME